MVASGVLLDQGGVLRAILPKSGKCKCCACTQPRKSAYVIDIDRVCSEDEVQLQGC